jgi:hypothetical protein
MLMTLFWDFALCGLVEVEGHSEVFTASIIRAISPESRLISMQYMEQHPKTQPSSYSPP